jgi:hypothetical protein
MGAGAPEPQSREGAADNPFGPLIDPRGRHAEQPYLVVYWWVFEFRVISSSRHVLRWFQHHFHTLAAPARRPTHIRLTIHAVIDDKLTRQILEMVASTPLRRLEGYLGEEWRIGAVAGLLAWCNGSPPSTSESTHALVRISPTEWLVTGRDESTVAIATVRMCRELLRTELALRGAYSLHASCAASDRTGSLLFVGASGSGKTTLALAVAQDNGYLVSADQTALNVAPTGPPEVVGFPWVARLGFGTLDALGAEQVIESVNLLRPQPAIVEGSIAPEARSFLSRTKVEITMLELDALLGVPSASTTKVDAVILLYSTTARQGLVAEPTTLDESVSIFRDEIREPDPVYTNFWLADEGELPQTRCSFDTLYACIQRLPVVALRWNPESDSAADALAAIVEVTGAR